MSSNDLNSAVNSCSDECGIVKSMTGFSSVHRADARGSLIISIKAVNSRYLETVFSSNCDLGALELEMGRRLSSNIKRGKLNISVNWTPAGASELTLNRQMLKSMISRLDEVHEAMSSSTMVKSGLYSIDPVALLSMPGMIQGLIKSDEGSSDCEAVVLDEQLQALFMETMDEAIAKFDEQRIREGQVLREVMTEKINAIHELLHVVDSQRHELVERERCRMLEKIEAMKIDIPAERIHSEIAMLAQKYDIAEEYDRLNCHLKTVTDILNTSAGSYAPAGKKLDFLMQELIRESNTLGSKAATVNLVNIAVELKVLVDQMREQVQNIE